LTDIAIARQHAGDLIESVITKGDLGKLSPGERTHYYVEVCRSVGLNPFTKPFEYIVLNGQLRLYARREATDQLRKINGISLEVISREIDGDLFVCHVRARDKTDRTDEDYGAVSIAGLRGEARANAIMKGITKGKRRVTLSLCGLGFLDENEIEDIPARDRHMPPVSVTAELDAFAAVNPPKLPDVSLPHATVQEPPADERLLERDARAAAAQGTEALRKHMRSLTPEDRDRLAALVGSRQTPGELLRLAQASDAAFQAAEPDDGPVDAFGLPAENPRDEAWFVVEGKNPRAFHTAMYQRIREARTAAEIERLRASNPAIDDLDKATREAVLNELANRERELRQREPGDDG
jgi:hypothetical protein